MRESGLISKDFRGDGEEFCRGFRRLTLGIRRVVAAGIVLARGWSLRRIADRWVAVASCGAAVAMLLRRLRHGRFEESFVVPAGFDKFFIKLGEVVCRGEHSCVRPLRETHLSVASTSQSAQSASAGWPM